MPIVILFFATYNPDTVIDADAAKVIIAMTKTYIDIPDAAARVNMTEEAFTAMLRK